MDAGPFDVLEQARDEDGVAVGDRVHVHLDALEVAVDADGPVRIDDGRARELIYEIRRASS